MNERGRRGRAAWCGCVLTAALAAVPLPAAQVVKSLRGDVPPTVTAEPPPLPPQEIKEGSFARTWKEQPPLIPHRMEQYEIDIKVNQCLRCHDRPYYEEAGATKISDSHYRDRDGNELDHVSRTRWFCTQCHVPQADIEPGVGNTFSGAGE